MTPPLRQFASVAEGLTFEAGLFSAQGPQVGLWTAGAAALVCPRAYLVRSGFAVAAAASAQRGWPVYLRPTGGGTVPQGQGVANLALAFDAPQGFTIEDGYLLLIQILRAGLAVQMRAQNTPDSFCDGDWNLTIGGRKMIGTAQRWRPMPNSCPRILAHAMILTSLDVAACADAVSAFYCNLGLVPIKADAHTSFWQETRRDLPAPQLLAAAQAHLANLTYQTDVSIKGGKHVQHHHPHPS